MINYIIGGLILLTVILAILKIRKDRKSGNCCGGCSGCSSAGHCSAYRDSETKRYFNENMK
jgi:hypothetical protein